MQAENRPLRPEQDPSSAPDHLPSLSQKETGAVNPKKGMEYVPDSAGGAAGNSDKITRAYLDAMLLVYRHIGSVEPNAKTEILGLACDTPIMASPLSLLDRIRENGSAEFAKGMARANALTWTGWIDDDAFRRVCDTGARVIRGIKPFQDLDKIRGAIETAAEAGAAAVFMDIDHCFDDTGRDCPFALGQLSHKTEAELRDLIGAAKGLPFILKGILDPADARKAKELGAGGVVVSHHHGIWCYSVPPAMMLPEIREAVGADYPVYADCGVHSGVDVYKYLASGANAVGVARELMTAFGKNGADGVYDRVMFLTDELLGTMAKTGCATVAEIGGSAIRMRSGW